MARTANTFSRLKGLFKEVYSDANKKKRKKKKKVINNNKYLKKYINKIK